MHQVAGFTPQQLTTDPRDRKAMNYLAKSNWLTITRTAKDAMIQAIIDSKTINPPIAEPSDYNKLAFLSEFGQVTAHSDAVVVHGDVFARKPKRHGAMLKCVENLIPSLVSEAMAVHPDAREDEVFKFRCGKSYPVLQGDWAFQEPYKKMHSSYNPELQELTSSEHDMVLSGNDSYHQVPDEDNDRYKQLRFISIPNNEGSRPWSQVQEMRMWDVFHMPDIPTVADIYKEEYDSNMARLTTMEQLQGFKFFPEQKKYCASIACKRSALISAETGCGKTLIAIALILLKNPKRCLIVAPKGTVEDGKRVPTGKRKEGEELKEFEEAVAQWRAELKKFGCHKEIKVINNEATYWKLADEYGELPDGVYMTWPQALFTSGKKSKPFESIPQAWSAGMREHKTRERLGYELIEPEHEDDRAEWPDDMPDLCAHGIGRRLNGVRIIAGPSLCTQIGQQFDMVIVDEAHSLCSVESQTTQAAISGLQAKDLFGMTATPLRSRVDNIFPLMGFICVDKWGLGGVSNPAWPYTIDDIQGFREAHLSYETDLTKKAEKQAQGVKNPNCTKVTSHISRVNKLLKLVKQSCAYISKKDLRPDIVDCTVYATQVPLGANQFTGYTTLMQPKNIPHNSPKTIFGVQTQWLIGMCAAPTVQAKAYQESMERYRNVEDEMMPYIRSNYNPKTIAILEKIYDCISRGEQVVHVSARIGLNTELQQRLELCGVSCSRIDSKAKNHVVEAHKFKTGQTQVMLMGIKCAQAYSFEKCHHLIIGSLDWSYGAYNQAVGRVYRLTSENPISVYVVLCKDTIEQLLWDKIGQKEDAATILLKGEHVPRDVESIHADDIMAKHAQTNFNRDSSNMCEDRAEAEWLVLKRRFHKLTNTEEVKV